MANHKKALDRSRPFASISSLSPRKEVYEQDGIYFGQDEREVGKVPGYAAKQRAAEEAAQAEVEAAEAAASADEALALLGLDNDDNEAENAAARQADELADD